FHVNSEPDSVYFLEIQVVFCAFLCIFRAFSVGFSTFTIHSCTEYQFLTGSFSIFSGSHFQCIFSTFSVHIPRKFSIGLMIMTFFLLVSNVMVLSTFIRLRSAMLGKVFFMISTKLRNSKLGDPSTKYQYRI